MRASSRRLFQTHPDVGPYLDQTHGLLLLDGPLPQAHPDGAPEFSQFQSFHFEA